MTESSTSAATAVWTAPECPFSIEYSLRALDDIRLAVMDAFFSLPRGGAEIGGVLLGAWEKGRLRITDYVALDCEHAFGPSFALSRNDESRLESLLKASYPNACVVGWYHSHTRSEIFLSQADLEVHNRFFPQAWQVAMVLRPHTFQPTHLGFFFRDTEGMIHSQSSYREDTLEPLPMRSVIEALPTRPVAESSPLRPAIESSPKRPVIASLPKRPVVESLPTRPVVESLPTRPVFGGDKASRSAEKASDPPPSRSDSARPLPARGDSLIEAAALAAARQIEIENSGSSGNAGAVKEADRGVGTETEPSALDVSEPVTAPTFGMPEEEDRTSKWTWVFAFAALIAVCFAAYATREAWAPKVNALLGREQQLPPSLGLNLIDREGQLQIHWNPQSEAIAKAVGGVLRISGAGPFPQEFSLDKAHLMNGYFTFQRQSERVDVALVIPQPGNSPPAASITTFIGKMPDKNPPFVEDPAAQKQREALAGQVDEMQKSLKDESQLNQQLKKSVDQLQKQLKMETQKRLTNQDK